MPELIRAISRFVQATRLSRPLFKIPPPVATTQITWTINSGAHLRGRLPPLLFADAA